MSRLKWPVFGEDEIAEVSRILRSGKVNYWTGEQGKLFEQEFADYIGCNYAVALANGTLALELALRILGIKENDEVIVPSRTFIATASAVAARGSRPVVADVDRESGNVTTESIDAVRTNKTKAIIVVHLAGWPCDMDDIMSYAKRHNLLVIEDCAQAHGAIYKGKRVGSFGDAAAFSFCQDKIITTGGEGGMLLVNDKAKWLEAWSYKDHGKCYNSLYNQNHPNGFRWLHNSFGSNYRMTEVQAAIGRIQLRKLDGWLEIRRKNALALHECFSNSPLLRLTCPSDNIMHAYYKYYTYIKPVMLRDGWSRDKILDEITKCGLSCFSGSCSEIYLEKAFKNKGFAPTGRLPIAKELGETSLMFQVDPTLSVDNIIHYCKTINNVLSSATIS